MATVAEVLAPTMWAGGFQANWNQNQVLSGLISSEFSGQLSQGQTVKVPVMAPRTVSAYDDALGFDADAAGRLSVSDITIACDQRNIDRFVITEIEQWIARPELYAAAVAASAQAHLEAYEAYILDQMIADGSAYLSGAAQDASDADKVLGILLGLRGAMSKAKAPRDGRVAALGSEAVSLLMANKLIVGPASNEELRNGVLGRLAGFDIVELAVDAMDSAIVAFHRSAVAGSMGFSTIQTLAAPTVVGTECRTVSAYGVEVVRDSGILVATLA